MRASVDPINKRTHDNRHPREHTDKTEPMMLAIHVGDRCQNRTKTTGTYPVMLQLAVLIVDDPRADMVQEATVMRHHHAGHVWQVGQLVLGWEAVQLSISNGPHEGGLASTIGATQAVPLATLERSSPSSSSSTTLVFSCISLKKWDRVSRATFSALSLDTVADRKTAASAGLSTSLDMLSMMTADLRLMAVCLSRSPLTSRGTMMDKAGASTACTKVVADSLWTVSDTSAGLAMAVISAGMNFSMSRLPTAVQAWFMVFIAAV
ncbi:MAG: hypothetical protein FRX49_02281 [Trebouxia sp. A1-2]|nr:MAG: hypothetical protein FRX49_12730 [Trebouxia sp. A1-2]KAA6427618.1 MAG: hypothetical protein FRX49_02281 [Trebouxia sp. A1-2]